MSTPVNKFCANCGAILTPGMRFCEHCGQPAPGAEQPATSASPVYTPPPAAPTYTPEPTYTPPVSYTPPAPSYNEPVSPPMGTMSPDAPKKGPSCVVIGLISGCVLLLCLVVAVFAGYSWMKSSGTLDDIVSQFTEVPFSVVTPEDVRPTLDIVGQPSETPVPDQPFDQPTATQGVFTLRTPTSEAVPPTQGNEQSNLPSAPILTDSMIFDDFSSEDFGWYVYDDTDGKSGYDNGAYFIRVFEAQWLIWVYAPVDFVPTTAEFDFWMPDGVADGTVGVLCHYQDNQNFYYVELDLDTGSYGFRSFINDEYNYYGAEEWMNTSALNTGDTNRVQVSCFPDFISLSLNGQQVDQVFIETQAQEGKMGLLVATWDTVGPDGFVTYFDNFLATR